MANDNRINELVEELRNEEKRLKAELSEAEKRVKGIRQEVKRVASGIRALTDRSGSLKRRRRGFPGINAQEPTTAAASPLTAPPPRPAFEREREEEHEALLQTAGA